MMDEGNARAWLLDSLLCDAATMVRLSDFASLLSTENARQTLVAASSLAQIWSRHIVDSAQLLTVPRETHWGGGWLDLGTGAGFPGMVIAICRPDIPVTLVDSRRLRIDWLNRATDRLGLANVQIIQAKVESLHLPKFQTISARAFAPLDRLLQISARFSTPDTHWLLPKGTRAAQEVHTLPKSWRHTFHVEPSITHAGAGIIAGRLLAGPQMQLIGMKR